MVATALHENSNRSKGPYIRVHCAALPENLLESELFGHVRGAYTGATTARAGRFEAAHTGTLLLDEIGEVPLSVQVKLLRVLQEREVERLGENTPRKVDVRIISATNKDLKKAVESGEFREDLYYRLNVIAIELPALRERREDIPLLAEHFLSEFALENQKEVTGFSPEATEFLLRYDWPGNVRQLKNITEQISIIEQNRNIDGNAMRAYLPSAINHLPALYKGIDEKTLANEREILYQD